MNSDLGKHHCLLEKKEPDLVDHRYDMFISESESESRSVQNNQKYQGAQVSAFNRSALDLCESVRFWRTTKKSQATEA